MPSCCHWRLLHEPRWVLPGQEAVRPADRTSSGGHARPGRGGHSRFHGRGRNTAVAADHGSADRPARRLAKIGGQDVEDEPADVGEQIAIVPEE
jgi:hypothetical protein